VRVRLIASSGSYRGCLRSAWPSLLPTSARRPTSPSAAEGA